MYAHEELIEELGLTNEELAPSLRAKVRTFNNKRRLSSKPESIERLKEDSEILADEIAEWYAEQEDLYDDEEYSSDSIVEKPKNTISHVTNNEVEDNKQDENSEEKPTGFGLGFLKKW